MPRKNTQKIENYVMIEADECVRVCSWLYREVPGMVARFKSENNFR